MARGRGRAPASDPALYIEGYPRSGTTFAVTAFRLANPGTPILAYKHNPSVIVRASELATPGMVLIRAPADAAASWSIFRKVTLQDALEYYVDYYSVLVPMRPDLFIASFEDVITDFGAVMRRSNERWGTAFRPFEHTDENVRACMARADDIERREGHIDEMRVSRPSAERTRRKQELLVEGQGSPAVRALLDEADGLFRRFVVPQPS
jgi:hypothetical protein